MGKDTTKARRGNAGAKNESAIVVNADTIRPADEPAVSATDTKAGSVGIAGTSTTQAATAGASTAGATGASAAGASKAGTSVEDLEQYPLEQKRGRGRPKGATKKDKPEEVCSPKIDKKQFVNISNKLISGVSKVAAKKAGQHWEIAEGEARQISEPLIELLDELGVFEHISMNKHAIALTIGCTAVFTPRITEHMLSKRRPENHVKRPSTASTSVTAVSTGVHDPGTTRSTNQDSGSSAPNSSGNTGKPDPKPAKQSVPDIGAIHPVAIGI